MYAFGLSVLVGLLAATTIARPAPADPAPPPPPPQTFPMADDAACSCLANVNGQQVRIPLNNTMPGFSVGLTECLPNTVIKGCPVAKPP